MPITSIATYRTRKKQNIRATRGNGGATTNTLVTSFSTLITPPAGNLVMADKVSGIIQTPAIAGYPKIDNFIDPLITGVSGCSGISFIPVSTYVYDVLWKAGTYAFNDSQVLSGQPSLASRLPNGDYSGVQVWYEVTSNVTGGLLVNFTYTNQDGVSGRVGTIPITTQAGSSMSRGILQDDDHGVMSVDSITGTNATAGAFNILLMRFIGLSAAESTGRKRYETIIDCVPMKIYTDTALMFQFLASTSTSGFLAVDVEITENA